MSRRGRSSGEGLGIEDLHRLLSYHRALLSDADRNRGFQRALNRSVSRRSRVLDIGAGTGVWAIAAARLGARVVAVEKERLLVPLIERLARDNGVSGQVEVVRGDSRRLKLPRVFDVIVSETVGNEGFDEGIVAILADARRRFLKPGGVLIPSRVSLMAAPARTSRPERLPAGLELDWSYFRTLAVHVPCSPARALEILAAPAELLGVDLGSEAEASLAREASSRWRVRNAAAIQGFAVWADVLLVPGLRLRTLSGLAWSTRLYETEPLPAGPAEVSFRLGLHGRDRRWEVGLRRGRRVEERSYGSVFAYGALRPHARMRAAPRG